MLMQDVSLTPGGSVRIGLHYAILLLAGLPGAMVRVVTSVYLVAMLAVDPLIVATYLNGSTILGMVVTYFAGQGRIDRHSPVVVACLGLLATGLSLLLLLGLGWSLWLLVPAAIINGLSQLYGPAIFMFDEKYRPPIRDAEAGMYYTRLVMSVIWIVGPPTAFYIYWLGGFGAVVWTSIAIIAASVALIIVVANRNVAAEPAATGTEIPASPAPPSVGLGAWSVFAVMVAVTAANVLHAIAMPLYLLKGLAAAPYLPGWFMALAAGSEVVVIFMIPRWTKKVSEETLLRIGLCCGLVYFALLFVVRAPIIMLGLQIIYGVHFALSTVVCLGLLKTVLNRKIGSVAAQFLNAGKLGALTGAGLFGLFSTHYGFGSVVMFGGLGLVGLAGAFVLMPISKRAAALP